MEINQGGNMSGWLNEGRIFQRNFALLMCCWFLIFLSGALLAKNSADLVRLANDPATHMTWQNWIEAAVLSVVLTTGWCIMYLGMKLAEKNCLACIATANQQKSSTPGAAITKAKQTRRRRHR